MQAEPKENEYIVYTTDGRMMQWPAFGYDSLLRKLHFYGHTATRIITLEEFEEMQAEMERAAEFMKREEERELKETA